jgi:TRAP-type C4-dicarboxylate transport system permease large subunit
MVNASHTSDTQRTTSWFSPLRALWAIVWRLSILLVFVGGVCFCILTDRWWPALGCIVGFVVASFVIRRVSTVEEKISSGESITFL